MMAGCKEQACCNPIARCQSDMETDPASQSDVGRGRPGVGLRGLCLPVPCSGSSSSSGVRSDEPSGKVVRCDFLQSSPDLGTKLCVLQANGSAGHTSLASRPGALHLPVQESFPIEEAHAIVPCGTL